MQSYNSNLSTRTLGENFIANTLCLYTAPNLTNPMDTFATRKQVEALDPEKVGIWVAAHAGEGVWTINWPELLKRCSK